MPRNVPLERILAVRQRQEHRVLAEEALSARRVLFEDTPFLRHTRHREAERQLNMAIASREAAFSDPACLSPRTNGFASPRPSPRQRALMTARLLPMLPTAANQAGGAGLDKVQNGRVPAERLRLHEMLRIVLAKAALAAEASGFQMSGPDSSAILTEAASDAIKAANTHVVARERPEVSLPPGPAEQGAVRRAERKARQSAADMRALRKSCELRRDEPRVQLVTALLGWNPELVFSSEQTSMCLRWLAWLESSQRTPQQLSPRASKPLQHEEPPVQCMKMEYVDNILNLMLHLGLAMRWQTRRLSQIAREEPWVAHTTSEDGLKAKTVDVDRLLLMWTRLWSNWDDPRAASPPTWGRFQRGVAFRMTVPAMRATTAPLL